MCARCRTRARPNGELRPTTTPTRSRCTSFPSAYTGTLHLYAIDWDSTDRRESITVNDGSGPHTVNITSDFSQGRAWTSFPVTVAAGGTVTITVTRTAGLNAVLSGLFLD